eukprot:6178262-Pleurochrysis_carterae.AAC.1
MKAWTDASCEIGLMRDESTQFEHHQTMQQDVTHQRLDQPAQPRCTDVDALKGGAPARRVAARHWRCAASRAVRPLRPRLARRTSAVSRTCA